MDSKLFSAIRNPVGEKEMWKTKSSITAATFLSRFLSLTDYDAAALLEDDSDGERKHYRYN